MPDFQEMFEKTEKPTIEWKGQTLYWADKFAVKNGEKLVVCIEKTNSEHTQGLSIDITGHCEMYGTVYKKNKGVKIRLWEDSEVLDIKHMELTVYTKTGFVWIQNVWERYSMTGHPYVDRGHNGAAMIVEEIENGKRYKCNDGHPDENFDDIVFTIRKIRD